MNFVKTMMLVLGCLISFCFCSVADASARYSAKFCIRDHRSYRWFDALQLGPSRMKFGLAIFTEHLMLVTGVADRIGMDSWRYIYVDPLDPSALCEVNFRLVADKRTVEFWGNPDAPCTDNGGVGTEVGHEYFSARSYKGRVTDQLKNDSQFFEKGGSC